MGAGRQKRSNDTCSLGRLRQTSKQASKGASKEARKQFVSTASNILGKWI